ncbi:hypothetical protein IFM89_008264 [Coptis chinensis]|uniref:PA domain-containing protein n=1 Tax=Coptis chinensis TaxID=261450 RepID=A0A835M494_9MAGN|nr:hypothetical protein IFM89_008264 [Coptis chinensis]
MTEPALRRGDSVYLVGLSRSLQATSRKSTVTNPCAALNIGSADYPRYRATNMEVIELDTDFGSTFFGVVTDDHGRVQAIWGSFSTQLKYGGSTFEDHQFVRGLPVFAISEVLDKIISGGKGPGLLINGIKRPMPLVRILEVELYSTLLSKARSFRLSDDWVQNFSVCSVWDLILEMGVEVLMKRRRFGGGVVFILCIFVSLLFSSVESNVVLIGRNVTLSLELMEANFGVARSPYVLIVRGGYTFEDKVRRAQNAGFEAAIIYDNEYDDRMIAIDAIPHRTRILKVDFPMAIGLS